MTDINTLLKKYSKPYVPGEQRNPEYNRKIKQERSIKRRISKTYDIYTELPFTLTTTQQDLVTHLIITNPNFKALHRKASEETIILAIIFYVKKQEDTRIQINKYRITRKYQLTHHTFETILCHLLHEQLKRMYIIPREPPATDHNLLYKGETGG